MEPLFLWILSFVHLFINFKLVHEKPPLDSFCISII